MYVLNITGDYDNIIFTNCTNIKNRDNNISFGQLLSIIPSSIILFSLINLMIYTLIKLLTTNKREWRNFSTLIILFVV